ncbi:hypothetical protein ASPWEDRAFT_35671 [Aspergillus wentii DTO 134E9]|uniref:Uncharacterized protein n=1 Tax=Aspergillus wentii DTO 134E9 TaxID=1073089 RepID=A0A1L9RTH8_ASPWE|nr:uncharacterized protein ASPWEDRAFT_35671 [Aspergillus wentii DTO 134E9]OJJ38107.1 hypothetical protein ASPWEDRAFT_35671 [Aspergillus wentii DTO 134E9]
MIDSLLRHLENKFKIRSYTKTRIIHSILGVVFLFTYMVGVVKTIHPLYMYGPRLQASSMD